MVDERDDEGSKDDLFEKEDKFDAFTPEGEALGYITLEQARLVAMQTARDDPGNYGSRFKGVRMVYEVVEQDEGEDYYTITMTFRPEGDFRGTPGREEFVIEKEGTVAYRQVPSLPSGGRRLLSMGLIQVVVGVIGVAVAIVGVLVGSGVLSGGGGGRETPVAALAPAAGTAPTQRAAAVASPVDTATPQPVPTIVPTVTPAPVERAAPVAPTRTPLPIVVAPPVDQVDIENLRFALRSLPPSFLEIDPSELGLSVAGLGPPFTELVAFASTDPLEFVFSAAGLMTNLERIQLENELSDPDRYLEEFAVGFSAGQDMEILDFGFLDIGPVGGRSIGVYVVFQSQGVVFRQDAIQFARGNLAGLIYNMYVPGEVPTAPADLAASSWTTSSGASRSRWPPRYRPRRSHQRLVRSRPRPL